jgi:hypothetical protein
MSGHIEPDRGELKLFAHALPGQISKRSQFSAQWNVC